METCRTCLRQSATLKPLFAEKNNLANRINDLFNFDFQITPIDNLPQNICYDCLTDLHHAFKFYENTSFAQHQLSIQLESVQELTTEEDASQDEEPTQLYVVNPYDAEEVPEVDIQSDPCSHEMMEVIPVMMEEEEESQVHDTEDVIEEGTEEYIIEEEFIQEYESRRCISVYTCDICSKSYDKKGSYQYHMKTKHVDVNERPFQCLVCLKRFAVKSDYTRHSRIHTNDKRFSCSECGKKFTDRSSHLKHERIHTGLKPHTCELCSKSFSYKFALDTHFLTHTGEKNFVCPDCSKRFARKTKMKDHFSRVHKRTFTEDDEQRSKLMSEKVAKVNAVEVPVPEAEEDLLQKSVLSISAK